MTLINNQAIKEALKSGASGTLHIDRNKKTPNITEIAGIAKGLRQVKIHYTQADALTAIAGDRHRGIAFEMIHSAGEVLPKEYNDWLEMCSANTAVILFLDGITDPHNLGAILRSADIFAVDAVVIPSRRTAAVTATVIEVSAGAANYVPLFQVVNLNRAIELAKKAGFWISGADMNGAAATEIDFTGRVGLVMGREGQGLHQQTAKLCDHITSIPMQGHIDSLNVSVAAGIFLFEIRRQHGWR